MITGMNDKDKVTLLEGLIEFVAAATTGISTTSTTGISTTSATGISTTVISTTSVTSTTTSNSNSSIEYDHRILTRLLQSSSSIKVTGDCDDEMRIYINGVQVYTEGNPPVYFNPNTDTLAIRGLDSLGGEYYCRIYFNDIQLPLAVVNNLFKCNYKDNWTQDPPTGWMDKDYDDSTWGGVYQAWGGFWATGQYHDRGGIYCRYHHEGILCKDGSEPYGGQCWCGRGYKSHNGLAPCEPCDDNAYTDALGSTMCRCAANAFSSTGYDTPNSCESCPGQSHTYYYYTYHNATIITTTIIIDYSYIASTGLSPHSNA